MKESDAPPEILCNGIKACASATNTTFADVGPRSEPGQKANERSEAIQRESIIGEAD